MATQQPPHQIQEQDGKSKTRVFLLSDHLILLFALVQLIGSESSGFEVCGYAASCTEALKTLGRTFAEVLLVDMEIGGEIGGIVSQLAQASSAKILLLTRMNDLEAQDQGILAGARGIVNQNATSQMLLTALTKVHEGQMWLDREATGRIFVEFSRRTNGKPTHEEGRERIMLTRREEKIIAHIAEHGEATGKVIAETLNISESTLRNHLTSIYGKLGVSNRVGLLNYAMKNGLIKPNT